ncbi:Lamin Tail Domain [Sinomicrobium oceani]|uniref:Lamin Tail Domain n=1 Tax=Sinomicrobium oceani TaxID=1150368 RepID=A0A1K1N5I5_9FLAO|nr:DUF5689 domain-containing protein [Sinomicrobium oceani]SFW30577.1 Lamin Tail Domain [Sinomicrobium oceani]
MGRYRFFSLVAMVLLWACVNHTYDAPAANCGQDGMEPNMTFSELKALYEGEVMEIYDDMVIEGYVISSDRTGNFYGTLHIQDTPENPSGGLQIDVDIRDYHLLYPVGKKIRVRLKGLFLGKTHEVFKIGGIFTSVGGNRSVGRLPATKVWEHIFATCDDRVDVLPVSVRADALNDDMLNTLVTLEGLEVVPEEVCKPYAIAGESRTDRGLQSCEGDLVMLKNSGYADFHEVELPVGYGRVTGVLSKYYSSYQLIIRDTTDVDLSGERCGGIVFSCDTGEADASIAYVRSKFNGRKTEIPENIKITGVVISDRESGHIEEHLLVLQDSTAGIVCAFTAEHSLNSGDRVEILLRSAVLEEEEGLLHVKDLPPDHIRFLESQQEPEPAYPDLSGDLRNYESRLVRLDSVSFATPGGVYSGVRIITDCSDALHVYTPESASFAETQVHDGSGSIFGIVSRYEDAYCLVLRSPDDVKFNRPYRDCLGGTDLMITEYVEGSGYNKYLEIYNATDVMLDLGRYQLARDYNGDGDYTRYTLELSGTLEPGGLLVYAHPRAEIFMGNIAETHGGVLGFNGDDRVVLMKNGMVIDEIGLPGGENWGMDKTLRRKPEVSVPVNVFREDEWETYPVDEVEGLGIR